MKYNLTIRQKMMYLIVGLTVVVYVISLGYISIQLRANAIVEAKQLAVTYANQKANEIKAVLDEDMAIARSMADAIESYIQLEKPTRDFLRESLLKNVLEDNPKYDATWMSWQYKWIDSKWKQDYGRERFTVFSDKGTVKTTTVLAELDGSLGSGTWESFRSVNGSDELMTEPYWYKEYGSEEDINADTILGVSSVVRIDIDGQFAGVIGADMTVGDFKEISNIDFYENGFAFLVSNSGVIISHKNNNLYSRLMDTLSIVKNSDEDILEKIKQAEPYSYTVFDEDSDEDVFVALAPIIVGKSDSPWSVGIVVPVSEITSAFNDTFLKTLIFALLGLAILIGITYWISSNMAKSLEQASFLLTKLAEGDLSGNNRLKIKSEDELGTLATAANKLMDDLIKKANFSYEIGRGNLNSEFNISGDNDMLGYSLITMRENLQLLSKETKAVITKAGENGEIMTARMDSNWEEGAWKDLSESINNLLDTVSTPFTKINDMVNAMSEGDLTVRYDESARGDVEIMALSFNKALDNINELIENISGVALVVAESSQEMLAVSEEMTINTREIASSISEMSNGAQNQVVKVDESSSLVEGILRSSNEMGEQSANINDAAQAGADSSEKGLDLVKKVGFSMRDIAAFSSDTFDSIQVLTKRSNEISKALSVITEIASQTNLLALNAAIEAAQAGDAGRGFAVVAEEIRKLAEDSKRSAKDIEKLVGDVQSDVSTAASAIDMMKSSVKSGEDATNFASEAFTEITESSSKTLVLTEEIRKRVQQQIESIKNVVTITESVVVIAEETAAGTEQIASSATELSAGMDNYVERSQSLSDIVNELNERLSKFRLK